MKNYEKEIVKSYEKNEWKSIDNLDTHKTRYTKYAKETLKKDKRLNIRLSSRDLEGIQRIAVSEGIPYQTLISSLIHKFVLSH